jgi:GDPmannose 4,6-dehydratase
VPNALVTGATGQDGGYLVERLLAEGYDVHVLVQTQDEATAQRAILGDRGQAHIGDLVDGSGLAEAIAAAAPDEVYNLAGISSVAFSWDHPELTIQISGVGVVRLMDCLMAWSAQAGAAPRFVQASSAELFGSPDVAPQNEATPIRPVSPYGAAKALAHNMVAVYRSRGLHGSTAILYNHESPRRPPQFVTRKITQAAARIAAGDTEPLVLGSMDVLRDWGWAPDYVDALVRIVRADAPGDFVVATGEAHSIADFVEAAFARVGITNWSAHVRTDAAFVRPADPALQVGDSTLLRTTLGWAPTRTFSEIVGAMVDEDVALLAAQASA